MKALLTASAAALAILAGSTFLPSTAGAANARNPYGNIDRGNDRGNSTGDSEVERLNSMQLNENYKGPYYPVGTTPPPAVAPLPPEAAQPVTPPPARRPAYRRARPHE